MSEGVTLIWVLGGIALLTCAVFVAIFVRFVTKALVSYLKHKPVAAMTIFVVSAGPTSFLTALLGVDFTASVLIGLGVGLLVLMFVAMELGSN